MTRDQAAQFCYNPLISDYVSVSIPESLYRRVRALARATQQPVDEVFVEALEQAFPVFYVDPERDRMQQEQDAYARLRDSLLMTHEGQDVAIHGGELVDADPDQIHGIKAIAGVKSNEAVISRDVLNQLNLRLIGPAQELWIG